MMKIKIVIEKSTQKLYKSCTERARFGCKLSIHNHLWCHDSGSLPLRQFGIFRAHSLHFIPPVPSEVEGSTWITYLVSY